jgi:adhesin/invasin
MVRVAQSSPAVFTASENGIGDGAIRHADFSLVTSSSPAVPGETILVYVTGLGTVTPTVADGEGAPSSPLSSVNKTPYVGIGGQYVTPSFAGLSPGFAGLYQMNVVVPTGSGTGDVALSVVVPGLVAASSATIPVAASASSNATVRRVHRHNPREIVTPR